MKINGQKHQKMEMRKPQNYQLNPFDRVGSGAAKDASQLAWPRARLPCCPLRSLCCRRCSAKGTRMATWTYPLIQGFVLKQCGNCSSLAHTFRCFHLHVSSCGKKPLRPCAAPAVLSRCLGCMLALGSVHGASAHGPRSPLANLPLKAWFTRRSATSSAHATER